MKFIDKVEGWEIQVELKYCERCGGLWLRPRGTEGVHCATCRARLAAMPDPGEVQRGQSRHRARGQEREVAIPTRIDHLQGVAGIEVLA